QFALSLNLNAEQEYDGGEVRFAEFGRQLYRPVMGGALVFSCSLLHEVIPVSRGRRFGLFTFLSASAPAAATRSSYSRRCRGLIDGAAFMAKRPAAGALRGPRRPARGTGGVRSPRRESRSTCSPARP